MPGKARRMNYYNVFTTLAVVILAALLRETMKSNDFYRSALYRIQKGVEARNAGQPVKYEILGRWRRLPWFASASRKITPTGSTGCSSTLLGFRRGPGLSRGLRIQKGRTHR